jgi:hypothetical protein
VNDPIVPKPNTMTSKVCMLLPGEHDGRSSENFTIWGAGPKGNEAESSD